MTTHRTAARDAAAGKPSTTGHVAEPARATGDLSNQALVQQARTSGSTMDLPGAPLDNQQQQSRARGGSSLPHRTAMEASFGRSLGHLDVRTGADELGAIGVNALATGNRLAFRDSTPSASVVAHEVTHALQSEQGTSSGFLAPRTSAAEQEAGAFAAEISRLGPGTRLPRPSAPPAGQVHLDPLSWKTSFSVDDQQMLADWIKADAPPVAPKFDPSLARFEQQTTIPGFSLLAGKQPHINDDQLKMIAEFIDTVDAPPAAPVPSLQFGTGKATNFSDADTAAIAKWIKTDPAGAPNMLLTDFSSHATADPFSHQSDPFLAQADPFKPKYDASICNTNCHGVVYQRAAPPAPTAPTWTAPDKATGEAAVKKEAQSTEETAEQIDLQVLSAKAAAISAAAAKGQLPPDLQQLWQDATLNAEALRLASPALARAKPGAPALPPPDPKLAAAKPADPTTPVVPEIDSAIAEATRTAIDAFYWSLVDALQVKEAEADAFTARWNETATAMKSAPPPCQTNCHAAPSDGVRLELKVAPPKVSPFVKTREKRLSKAASVAEWKGVLDDFDITSTVTLEDLLLSILPPDAKELTQLAHAAQLRNRVRDLQAMHGDAIRIPAVFYPENDLATETGADGKSVTKPQGYSWYLFLYKRPDGYFVLKDLTSGLDFTNTEGESNIESVARHSALAGPFQGGLLDQYPEGVMQRLIGQLDSKLHMPKGVLHYTLPGGRQRVLQTTASWELSDWLRAIGLTLAAIGVVALTGGAGTAAGIAFVGAGLAGAASSKAALEEMEAQGIATDSDRGRAYLNIAVDLVGALAGGVGMIARAPSMFGQLALVADRVYVPLRAASAAGELAQAALMTHDFVQNLQVLAAQPSSKERTTAIVKLVGMGLAMGALSFISLKGAVHDVTSGARPRVVANGDGTYSLVGPSGLPAVEGSGGFKWKAKADVAATVEDAGVGKKSVVIDVEKDANGIVTSVAVRKGSAASAADIALHEKVADMVARYGGAQGRLRKLWRDILGMFGFRRPPVELELEIFKLEQAANIRIKKLSSPGVTEGDRLAAERELAIIENNLERARTNAQAALKKPAQTAAQRAQIWMKEQPEGLPTAPEGTQWVRSESGRWDLASTSSVPGGPQYAAVYDAEGTFIGISNRGQVARARVVGRTIGEVQDRLEAMGYAVETSVVDGVTMRRLVPNKPHLVPLEVDASTGVVKGPAAGAEKWVPPKSWNGPSKHGRWVGGASLKGNTGWIDDRADVIRVVGRAPNGEANPIAFDHGRADFAKYSQGEITVPGITGVHNADMNRIYEKVADIHGLAPGGSATARRNAGRAWLKAQPDGYGGLGLSPHHSGGDTIQLIPTAVHRVQHTDMFDYGAAP